MLDEDHHLPEKELPYISSQIASIVATISHLRSQVAPNAHTQRLSLLGAKLEKFSQTVHDLLQCLQDPRLGNPESDNFNKLYVHLMQQCQLVIRDLNDNITRDLQPETLNQFDQDRLAPFERYLDTNYTVFIFVTQLSCL